MPYLGARVIDGCISLDIMRYTTEISSDWLLPLLPYLTPPSPPPFVLSPPGWMKLPVSMYLSQEEKSTLLPSNHHSFQDFINIPYIHHHAPLSTLARSRRLRLESYRHPLTQRPHALFPSFERITSPSISSMVVTVKPRKVKKAGARDALERSALYSVEINGNVSSSSAGEEGAATDAWSIRATTGESILSRSSSVERPAERWDVVEASEVYDEGVPEDEGVCMEVFALPGTMGPNWGEKVNEKTDGPTVKKNGFYTHPMLDIAPEYRDVQVEMRQLSEWFRQGNSEVSALYVMQMMLSNRRRRLVGDPVCHLPTGPDWGVGMKMKRGEGDHGIAEGQGNLMVSVGGIILERWQIVKMMALSKNQFHEKTRSQVKTQLLQLQTKIQMQTKIQSQMKVQVKMKIQLKSRPKTKDPKTKKTQDQTKL